MALRKTRIDIIELLGGKCVKCGFSDIRALQIDHVKGGGVGDLKKGTNSAYYRIRKAVIAGSKDYQVLCANCNWIKRFEDDPTNSLCRTGKGKREIMERAKFVIIDYDNL